MHPVDQYEAFRKLIEVEGKTLEEVADVHGVSALTVRRRMALSKVAPELLALYRGNQITQDQLQVLALVEDHATHGVSEPTYYKWKSQFSGMTVPHLSQLRQLQDENAELKRMYADLALMHHALKDVVDRKL